MLPQNRLISLSQIYELRVMETKPDRAVSIIECDMNVSGRGRKGGWGPWVGVMQPWDSLGERGGRWRWNIVRRPLTL